MFMRRPEKPRIFAEMCRARAEASILSFGAVLVPAIQSGLGVSLAAAEAYAQANSDTCWNYVLKQLDLHEARGLSRLFEVFDHRRKLLRWWAVDKARCGSSELRRLERLKSRPVMLGGIDLMTDREYEALGCAVCEFLGAANTHLTPKGGEGGVDFFAVLIPPGFCHLFSGASGPLRIIGQCKKHASAAQDSLVRDFLTTVGDIYRQNPNVEKHVPAWFRKARGPIAGWIISHSGFQSSAEKRCRDHGVVSSDSLDIAEILARCLSGCPRTLAPKPGSRS